MTERNGDKAIGKWLLGILGTIVALSAIGLVTFISNKAVANSERIIAVESDLRNINNTLTEIKSDLKEIKKAVK